MMLNNDYGEDQDKVERPNEEIRRPAEENREGVDTCTSGSYFNRNYTDDDFSNPSALFKVFLLLYL